VRKDSFHHCKSLSDICAIFLGRLILFNDKVIKRSVRYVLFKFEKDRNDDFGKFMFK
jgi:hypothetical protein